MAPGTQSILGNKDFRNHKNLRTKKPLRTKKLGEQKGQLELKYLGKKKILRSKKS